MRIEYPPDRQSARLAGSTKYFTGRPCPNEHVAPRYTSNGACTLCLGLREEDAAQGERIRSCEDHKITYSARQCPECKREWRQSNPPSAASRVELAEAQRDRAAICRAYARQARRGPCQDCKKEFPWYVMEFDHPDGRGEGGNTVATLIGRGNLERVKAEIAKCDLVCANCHKIRTHLRAVDRGERLA